MSFFILEMWGKTPCNRGKASAPTRTGCVAWATMRQCSFCRATFCRQTIISLSIATASTRWACTSSTQRCQSPWRHPAQTRANHGRLAPCREDYLTQQQRLNLELTLHRVRRHGVWRNPVCISADTDPLKKFSASRQDGLCCTLRTGNELCWLVWLQAASWPCSAQTPQPETARSACNSHSLRRS